jgi:hypothetical protein
MAAGSGSGAAPLFFTPPEHEFGWRWQKKIPGQSAAASASAAGAGTGIGEAVVRRGRRVARIIGERRMLTSGE